MYCVAVWCQRRRTLPVLAVLRRTELEALALGSLQTFDSMTAGGAMAPSMLSWTGATISRSVFSCDAAFKAAAAHMFATATLAVASADARASASDNSVTATTVGLFSTAGLFSPSSSLRRRGSFPVQALFDGGALFPIQALFDGGALFRVHASHSSCCCVRAGRGRATLSIITRCSCVRRITILILRERHNCPVTEACAPSLRFGRVARNNFGVFARDPECWSVLPEPDAEASEALGRVYLRVRTLPVAKSFTGFVLAWFASDETCS